MRPYPSFSIDKILLDWRESVRLAALLLSIYAQWHLHTREVEAVFYGRSDLAITPFGLFYKFCIYTFTISRPVSMQRSREINRLLMSFYVAMFNWF